MAATGDAATRTSHSTAARRERRSRYSRPDSLQIEGAEVLLVAIGELLPRERVALAAEMFEGVGRGDAAEPRADAIVGAGAPGPS